MRQVLRRLQKLSAKGIGFSDTPKEKVLLWATVVLWYMSHIRLKDRPYLVPLFQLPKKTAPTYRQRVLSNLPEIRSRKSHKYR